MSDTFDKSAILESFLDEVTSYLPEIEANLDRLQQRPDQMDMIEETYRRAHTIAGSAAMMEFGALSHVAAGIEDTLGNAIDQQISLDASSIALLRRSFGRLKRLVDNVRTGGDSAALVAEDDADRAASRGAQSQPGVGGQSMGSASGPGAYAFTPGTDTASQPAIQVPDWLAAFAGPGMAGSPPTPQNPQSAASGPGAAGAYFSASGPHPQSPTDFSQSGINSGDDRWASSLSNLPTGRPPAVMPDRPGAASQPGVFDRAAARTRPNTTPFTPPGNGADPSMEEMLQAFRVSDPTPSGPAQSGISSRPTMPPPAPHDYSTLDTSRQPTVPRPGSVRPPVPAAPLAQSPQAYGGEQPTALDDLRADTEALRRNIATLRDLAASVRDAAHVMENERAELRGFLDGSRDALDRLEEWSGRQMGLDLGNSPDSVRRYLPLSVIWVVTARLKSLATLLTNASNGVTVKQEELEESVRALRATIESVGQIYGSIASVGGDPSNGFSATVAQVRWSPPPAEPPSIHADLSPANRAELEREVRDQLRRELEDEVRGEIAAEVRRDEEDRIRQELQIQVRRQILSELTPGMGGIGGLDMPREPGRSVLPNMPLSAERVPKPVQVTSEQSPEALDVFREEAQEHVQAITTGIAQLEATPGDTTVLQSIRRPMHTLKGAAGMMGFTLIQQIAHASEDLLDRLVEGAASLTPAVHSLLLDTSELLDDLVVSGANQPDERVRDLLGRYSAFGGEPAADALARASTQRDAIAVDMADEQDERAERSADTANLSVRVQLSKLDDLVNLFGELLVSRSILEERLERMSRIAGETVVAGEHLRTFSGDLEKKFEAATLPSGRGGSSQSANGNRGFLGLSLGGNRRNGGPSQQDFDPLELDQYNEFHPISRGLSESSADVLTLSHEIAAIIREAQDSFTRENRLTSEFQDRLLKARLVPLQSLVPQLYRAARASALKEGKEVEFFTEGAETEVDRKVSEEVAGPLLHLVRNSVNHGIERPNARELAGKPRAGRITISSAYEGNQVVISVSDDGMGIDPEHIRQTAIARGWIDAYSHLSDKEAINLIFRQGITTAESLTEEAGRGVGLDVVRDAVTRLRGTIEVDSTVGQGTTFTLKFPIGLQIARAVMVKVGPQTLAIPMTIVDQIGRLDYYQRIPGPTPAVEMRGERYPLAYLADYLRLPPGELTDRSSLLLVNAGKRRVALIVDAIAAQQEIVTKQLGPHLREVPGIAGAAVLGNGQVVLILELHELLAAPPRTQVVLPAPGAQSADASTPSAPQPFVVSRQPATPRPPVAPPTRDAWTGPLTEPAPRVPVSPPPAAAHRDPISGANTIIGMSGISQHHVAVPPSSARSYLLVVDDSPSVRRVVSGMLKAHGWEVQTARDGVEALDLIARQTPAAVLLDIEMPRMDGYELLATVRSQEQYANLPMIVLTSRAAAKHHQRAIQLGANEYVVKPYQDEDLLNIIARLVRARQG
ncbi:MAG: Signal transduction histidine kinase CheA [Ktedonobacterales bacterium]|jgi:chemotaxis protein histidine kinase CheA/CheY-like chemotaxis protein|nr:MAG: Signal transduction histidine kinase CheA [Ktedonobacterales bacterium]